MLIYHITKRQLYCTEVMETSGPSMINHHKRIINTCHKDHRPKLQELRNNGKVFVTGGTYASAVHKGTFEDRNRFIHYMEDLIKE